MYEMHRMMGNKERTHSHIHLSIEYSLGFLVYSCSDFENCFLLWLPPVRVVAELKGLVSGFLGKLTPIRLKLLPRATLMTREDFAIFYITCTALSILTKSYSLCDIYISSIY
ncbi:hypothetical protein ACJX0J_007679, partial [Zea mays]